MGFKAAAASVASKQGISQGAANAIIAAGARGASPAAKKANPNLKKVAAPKKAAGKSMADPIQMAIPPQLAKAAKKATKKAAPAKKAAKGATKMYGETGVKTPRQTKQADTLAARNKRLQMPNMGVC